MSSSILQELLQIQLLKEFEPGHPEDRNKPTDNEEEETSQEEPSQHIQNSKEMLTKLFKDADDANTLMVYVPQTAYEIRQAKEGEQIHISWPGETSKVTNAEPDQYVVRNPEQVSKIKLIDKEEFEEKYEQMNPQDHPDAEGFMSYRTKDEILAFQYTEKETLSINVSGHTIKIEPEDYVGHPASNAKQLIVMSKTDFEKKYRLS